MSRRDEDEGAYLKGPPKVPSKKRRGPPRSVDPRLQAFELKQRGLTIEEIALMLKMNEGQARELVKQGTRLINTSATFKEGPTELLARFDPGRLVHVLGKLERRLDELEARFDILPPEYRRDTPPALWEFILNKIYDHLGSEKFSEYVPDVDAPMWMTGETIPHGHRQPGLLKLFAQAILGIDPNEKRT